MKTIRDLGALVKSEAPGEFDGMSDEEVGRMMKLQYPGEFDHYLDTSTSLQSYQQNPLVRKAAELVEYYDPQNGRFSSWWQEGRSEARARLQTVLSQEQTILLKQAAEYEEAVIQGKKRVAEYNSFVMMHEFELGQMRAMAVLITQALAEGYNPEDWKNEKVKRADHEREMERIKLEHKCRLEILSLEADMKFSDSVRETNTFREKEAIKLNNLIKEKQEELRLVILTKKMSNYTTKLVVQEKLDDIYKQIEKIRNSNFSEETKKRMIRDRNILAKQFENYRDAL